MSSNQSPLLSISNLTIVVVVGNREVELLRNLHLEIFPQQTIALVGESGAGKSLTAQAILQLFHSPYIRVKSGVILYQGENLLEKSAQEMQKIRGREIAFISQNPQNALNPTLSIGFQLTEHLTGPKEERKAKALEMLHLVGIAAAADRFSAYPHQLSGGMKQRVLIAMSLLHKPKLLIADEPTTALDVTIQAEIIYLLKELQQKLGMALLFITHDLGIVAQLADIVAVLYSGQLIEANTVHEIFYRPRHPYTQGLLAAAAHFDHQHTPQPTAIDSVKPHTPLFEVQNLSVEYIVGKKKLTALCDISLSGSRGETLGIVGESGSGKSTLGKTVLQLQKQTSGQVFFEGVNVPALTRSSLRALRKEMQMVLQDPDSSLNPRMTVAEHLHEALQTHLLYKDHTQIDELLDVVQLPSSLALRYPFELSGGQKQRVSIARSLSVNPKLLVLDEPLSSLDVPIRVQIIQLLKRLQEQRALGYLLITHDLATLRHFAHKIAVLYFGQLMELAPVEVLYTAALHPYTQALLAAVAIPDPEREKKKKRIFLKGDPPSPFTVLPGCPFQTRCPKAQLICQQKRPLLQQVATGHFVACHLYA